MSKLYIYNGDEFRMELVCEICEQKFESKMGMDYLLKKYNRIICKNCSHRENMARKYGTYENYCKYVQQRIEASVEKKYGVKNVSQIKSVREKMKKIMNEKGFQEKRMTTLKENNKKKYGVEHTFQREDCKNNIKRSMMDKYGVEHPLQNSKIKEKAKDTMNAKYGVDNIMHDENVKNKVVSKIRNKTPEEWSKIALKRRKKYIVDGIGFDSLWEVKVYKYCKENNIEIERGPTVILSDGHKFEIDFIINGRLCEIKSSWYIKSQKRSELKKEYILQHNGFFISDEEIKDLSFLKI